MKIAFIKNLSWNCLYKNKYQVATILWFLTNIFKDSNYLNSLGIDLPIITDFILKLNNHGFNIDSSINNIDHLVLAIGGEING